MLLINPTSDIQAIFDSISPGQYFQRGEIVFTPGEYVIQETINLTNRRQMVIRFEEGAIIRAATNGLPVFDLTGSGYIQFFNLNMIGDANYAPNVGFLITRSTYTHGVNAAYIAFNDCQFSGKYILGPIYCLNGESLTFNNCLVENAEVGEFCIFSGAYNDFNLVSAFATINEDIHSASRGTIWNCKLSAFNSPNASIIVLGEAAHGWSIRDCFIAGDGKAGVLLKGFHQNVILDLVAVEGTPDYTILFEPVSGLSNVNRFITISNSGGAYSEASIKTSSGVILTKSDIYKISGNKLQLDGITEYCNIRDWFVMDNAVISGNIFRFNYVDIPPYGTKSFVQEDRNTYDVYSGIVSDDAEIRNGHGLRLGAYTAPTLKSFMKGSVEIVVNNLADDAKLDDVIVPVNGCQSGDFVIAALSGNHNGIIVAAQAVNAAVRVSIQNRSGAVWNPGNLVVSVFVLRVI